MQVIATNDTILCNYEVLELLKEKRITRPKLDNNNTSSSSSSNNNNELQNREIIEKNTLKYLELQDTKKITSNMIKLFIEQLKNQNIELTKAEYMVLLNHMPQNPVEIYLIVEECSERLNDDQVQFILESVNKYLRNPSTS